MKLIALSALLALAFAGDSAVAETGCVGALQNSEVIVATEEPIEQGVTQIQDSSASILPGGCVVTDGRRGKGRQDHDDDNKKWIGKNREGQALWKAKWNSLSEEERKAFIAEKKAKNSQGHQLWKAKWDSLSEEERKAFIAKKSSGQSLFKAKWESLSDEQKKKVHQKSNLRGSNLQERKEKWDSLSLEEKAAIEAKRQKFRGGNNGKTHEVGQFGGKLGNGGHLGFGFKTAQKNHKEGCEGKHEGKYNKDSNNDKIGGHSDKHQGKGESDNKGISRGHNGSVGEHQGKVGLNHKDSKEDRKNGDGRHQGKEGARKGAEHQHLGGCGKSEVKTVENIVSQEQNIGGCSDQVPVVTNVVLQIPPAV